MKAYEGQYQFGKEHGQGTSYLENGYKAYEGNWANGEKHGFGIEF